MNKNQTGFTLLELMISILLGLIIVAAGSTIFLSAQKSMGIQIGMGEVQQNANFGLSILTHDLRHANLNMPSDHKVNNKVVGSGIIFNRDNLPSSLATTPLNLLTQQGISSDASTESSDQITIQFKPQYRNNENTVVNQDGSLGVTTVTSNSGMFNCEGGEIRFEASNQNNLNNVPVAQNPIVVQRYYLDEIAQTSVEKNANVAQRFGLYCDYGFYEKGASQIQGLNANAKLIMSDIDAFRARLAVRAPNRQLSYLTINEYLAKMPNSVTDAADYFNVISIEIGLLARANTHSASKIYVTKSSFELAGSQVDLDAKKTNTSLIRQEISQVIGLRNTLGAP